MSSADSPRGDLLASLIAQVKRGQRYYRGTTDARSTLSARAEVSAFIETHLDSIRELSTTMPVPATAAPNEQMPVFTYWHSGVDDAPPVVRACLAQLLRVHPDAHILDARTVREYLTIPPIIAARLEEHRPAHFSDYLRVALLERYGGIWVDATCFVPEPLTGAVAPLLDAGVLYLRWAGRQISNWFIVAEPGNVLMAYQRAALLSWWTENDRLPDYFLYHRIFEALDSLAPEVHRVWRSVPRISTVPSHILQLAMYRRFDPDELRTILDTSFVHKLSYKYDPGSVPADSILARLVSGKPFDFDR